MFQLDSTPTRKPKRFEPIITAQPNLFDVGADWLPGQAELFPEEDAQPGDVSLDELREKPKGFTIEVDGLSLWFDGELEEIPADCFLLRTERGCHLLLCPPKYANEALFTFATLRTLIHGASDNGWEMIKAEGLGNFTVRFRGLDQCPVKYLPEGTRFRAADAHAGVLTVAEWRNDWKVGARTDDGRCVKLDAKTICTPA